LGYVLAFFKLVLPPGLLTQG